MLVATLLALFALVKPSGAVPITVTIELPEVGFGVVELSGDPGTRTVTITMVVRGPLYPCIQEGL
jgi:hypothetical protein